MKEIIVKIDEDVVNNIQLKDFEAAGMRSVIMTLIETHSAEKNPVILDSPIFIGYQTCLANKTKEFEKAKSDMLKANVKPELQDKIVKWNLDYNSCELSLQIRD